MLDICNDIICKDNNCAYFESNNFNQLDLASIGHFSIFYLNSRSLCRHYPVYSITFTLSTIPFLFVDFQRHGLKASLHLIFIWLIIAWSILLVPINWGRGSHVRLWFHPLITRASSLRLNAAMLVMLLLVVSTGPLVLLQIIF